MKCSKIHLKDAVKLGENVTTTIAVGDTFQDEGRPSEVTGIFYNFGFGWYDVTLTCRDGAGGETFLNIWKESTIGHTPLKE